MDILLVNSHRYVCGYLPGSNLGINILRQILQARGLEAEEFQGYAGDTLRIINEAMEAKAPPKVVGFYCDYNNVHWVRRLAARVKQSWPVLRLIAGGPQASGFDADFYTASGVEAACIGEAEETLPELLEYLLHGKGRLPDIQGIAFPGPGQAVITTPPRTPPQSLDDIPWPDLAATVDYSHYRLLPLLTGRGCPFGCTFCYEGANAKRVRHHSVPAVLAEIERNFEREPNIRYVNLLDDTFTLDKKRVLEICSGMEALRKKHDFVWFASAHIQTMHKFPELAPAMAKAGLKKLFFGLESGDDRTLAHFNKHITRQMIIDTIRHCVDSGIHSIAGNIILGGPYEDEATVSASVSLVDELLHMAPGRFETAYFTFLPYPNTPITNNPEAFGMRVLKEREDCCLEDIPLSETDAYGCDRMMSLRLETNRSLQNKMLEIYRSGEIPEETILEIYHLNRQYGVYTRWLEYAFKRSPIDDAYWKMRADGRFVPSGLLPQDGAGHCLVRTFEIWLYADYSSGRPAFFSTIPTDLEFCLLTLCNGKSGRNQVIQQAYKQMDGRDEQQFFTLALAALKVLEERRWVLYTKRKTV